MNPNGRKKLYTEDQILGVRNLYIQGFSTREITKQTGISKSRVFDFCKDIIRTKSDANKDKPKKETTHWRTMRQRARKLMEEFLGYKLSRLQHVHHIDADFTNNSIENLQVLAAADHIRHHVKKWDIPRHKIPARIAYQKTYMKKWWANKKAENAATS